MDKLTGIISSAELIGGQIVGMRGLKGDKGDKGDTGESATIAVGTVTTGDAGTSATVTNIGDSHNAVFDFTIPKGDKGDTGATGDVNTYIAEYGTATYAEIGSAISDGKYVVAQYNNDYYPLIMFSNSSYVFSYIHENICYEVVCDSDSIWTSRSHTNVRDVKQNGASVTTSGVALVTVPTASSTTPKMDGTASAGSETTWAKGDHIHPSDTSKADVGHTHTKSDVTDFTHTHTKSDITDFPTLATVATSGDYDDLTDKPSIHNVPSGGTKGQVLTKDSSTDYDASWANPEVTLATLESLMPTDTASGAIASFPDGQNLFPLKSLVADIDPIQDLHGYDAPWVGGAGGNLWQPFSGTGRGITFTPQGDGTVAISGTLSQDGWPQISKDYTLTELGWSVGDSFYVYVSNTEQIGSAIRFLDSDGIQLSHLGSNTRGTVPEGTATVRFIQIGARGTAPSTGDVINTVGHYYVCRGTTSPTTWTPWENLCPISGHTEVDVVVSPTTDEEDGNTYTTALGRTVYGGTLDLVSGELTVTHGAVDMGSLAWYSNGAITGGMQYAVSISDKKVGETNFICSAFETHTPSAVLGYICGRATTTVVVCNATQTVLNDFKTAVTGQTICYELATPQTYQLTPQQIQTLLGQNNVWANSGDVEVIYKADIQKWVEKKTDELNTAILALA